MSKTDRHGENARSKHVCLHPRRTARRERAIERMEARAGRSAEDQLRLLEERGHGRCREARRLRAELALSA